MLVVLMSSAVLAFTPMNEPNMNADKYLLQATPHGQAVLGNWSTAFKDYPGGVEYFEAYAGPVTTTYGQVFWKGLPDVPLPAALVARFDDRVMAVVGFEADQVRRKGDKDVDGSILQADVSVPINVAYNHHYGATLYGKGSSAQKVRVSETADHRAMHPGPDPGWATVPVEHTPSLSGQPTSMVFGYSNGGEFRKTYHGLAPPFAQLVDSPTHVSIGPMQIDTWNRDKMNITGGKFVAGPAPRNSFAPTDGVDAIYSGLLECPLTSRIRKTLVGGGWNDSHVVRLGSCGATPIPNAATCFDAAAEIGLGGASVSNGTGRDPSLPPGCSVRHTVGTATAKLYFNTDAASTASCGAGTTAVAGTAAAAEVGVTLGLNVDSKAGVVTITMSGPAAVWFGVGFDTQFMANSPYAITIDCAGKPTERVLGDHVAGVVIITSVTVVSNANAGGVRTVVMTRPLKGLTPHHHTFTVAQVSLDFIAAVGTSPVFAYHRAKSTATLALWPAAAAAVDPTGAGGMFGLFGGAAPVGTRNDWTGSVGYAITTARPITVTALGRAGGALKATALVTIFDADRKVVAQAPVGPDKGGAVEDGYTYINLTSPVSLKSGAQYFVVLAATAGMADKFADDTSNPSPSSAASNVLPYLASVGLGVFGTAPAGTPGTPFPDTTSVQGRWAGIVTLKAEVAAHPVAPPGVPPPACVCSVPAALFSHGEGTLTYLPTGETIGFPPRCQLGAADSSVMRNRNPTCDIRTYVGGLSTCHDGWYLLDAEQELPWPDQPISYYMKVRLYYQEFSPSTPETAVAAAKPASHVNAFDITWSIAGATGEYDVPRCAPGTPTEKCTHEISGHIVPPGTDYHFVAAHYHCHAPTCISLEIWNNRTGELLCKEVPYHGAATAATQADRFDEPGYIAQRICLWGLHPPFEYPPLVSGETLFVKAVTNSTYGHHGEMALPQMLLAQLPPSGPGAR